MSKQLVNYDSLVKKVLGKGVEYKNKSPYAPKWPFRMLVCGESGSGKTNLVFNLLFRYLHFDRLIVIAKDTGEEKYEALQKILEPTGLFTLSDTLEALPELNSLNPRQQTLVIIDDFVTEKDQKAVNEYFIRGRKRGVSLIYLTQSYYHTPMLIRKNISHIALYPVRDGRNIKELTQTLATDVSKEEFEKIFKAATGRKYDFLFVDLNEHDKRRKYRRGLEDGLVVDEPGELRSSQSALSNVAKKSEK